MAKHSKAYMDIRGGAMDAYARFDADVKNGVYPAPENGRTMDEQELHKFMNELENSKYSRAD